MITALCSSVVILLRVLRMLFVAYDMGHHFPCQWVSWIADWMIYCCLLTYIARSWKLIFWMGWNQQQLDNWNRAFRRKLAQYRERIERSHRELKRRGEEFKSAVLAELTPRTLYAFQSSALATPRSLMFASRQTMSESYDDDDARLMRIIQQKRRAKIGKMTGSDRKSQHRRAMSHSMTHSKSQPDLVLYDQPLESSSSPRQTEELQGNGQSNDLRLGSRSDESQVQRKHSRSKSLDLTPRRNSEKLNDIDMETRKAPDVQDTLDGMRECHASKLIAALTQKYSIAPQEEASETHTESILNSNESEEQEKGKERETQMFSDSHFESAQEEKNLTQVPSEEIEIVVSGDNVGVSREPHQIADVADKELDTFSHGSEIDTTSDDSDIDLEIGESKRVKSELRLDLSLIDNPDINIADEPEPHKPTLSKKTSFCDSVLMTATDLSTDTANSTSNIQINKLMAIDAKPSAGTEGMKSKPKRFSSISRRSHVFFGVCAAPIALTLIVLAAVYPRAIPSFADCSRSEYEHFGPTDPMLFIQV